MVIEEKKKNNVRYNVIILDEIIDILKKKKSFKALSENTRKRYIKIGQCDNSKVDDLCNKTGIERTCFIGEKRFFIPECEDDINQNPLIFDDIYNMDTYNYLPNFKNFKKYVEQVVESFKRNELIVDENLERLIYYVNNKESMEGYIREDFDIKQLCFILEHIECEKLIESDRGSLEKFVHLASEKIIVAQAALIMKNKRTN